MRERKREKERCTHAHACSEREGEGERQEAHTHTHAHTHTERERERERETHTPTCMQREREREREGLKGAWQRLHQASKLNHKLNPKLNRDILRGARQRLQASSLRALGRAVQVCARTRASKGRAASLYAAGALMRTFQEWTACAFIICT